jgi:DNA-binding MarR family transcriptional regulator
MEYGELLHSILISLQSVFKKHLGLTNVSFQKIIALSIIPPDGIEMSSLSKKLGIDNSTATRLISGMEKIGWLRRKVASHDKRVIKVFLTKKGNNIQIALEKKIETIGDQVERHIDPLKKQDSIEQISSLNWILLKLSLNN